MIDGKDTQEMLDKIPDIPTHENYLFILQDNTRTEKAHQTLLYHYHADNFYQPLLAVALNRNAPDFVLRGIKEHYFFATEALDAIERSTQCNVLYFAKEAYHGSFKNDIIVQALDEVGLNKRYLKATAHAYELCNDAGDSKADNTGEDPTTEWMGKVYFGEGKDREDKEDGKQ